jgi:hypothetical protein
MDFYGYTSTKLRFGGRDCGGGLVPGHLERRNLFCCQEAGLREFTIWWYYCV